MGTKNKENKRINEEKKRKKKKLRADGESTSRRQATNQIRIPADRGRGGPSIRSHSDRDYFGTGAAMKAHRGGTRSKCGIRQFRAPF